jgi:hypothetical protein
MGIWVAEAKTHPKLEGRLSFVFFFLFGDVMLYLVVALVGFICCLLPTCL